MNTSLSGRVAKLRARNFLTCVFRNEKRSGPLHADQRRHNVDPERRPLVRRYGRCQTARGIYASPRERRFKADEGEHENAREYPRIRCKARAGGAFKDREHQ